MYFCDTELFIYKIKDGTLKATAILNGRVITPAGLVNDAVILFDDALIIGVAPCHEITVPTGAQVLDARGLFVSPGYLDSHIHGSFGYDFSNATLEQVGEILGRLPSVGVTAVLPTVSSSSSEVTTEALATLQRASQEIKHGARIVGVHLEGPYLNYAKRGAQPEQFLREPNIAEMQNLLDRFKGFIRMVTLAPELPGSLEMIALLKKHDVVVSLGHSSAHFVDVEKAFMKGADRMAHFFSTMSPLHHREPGMVGAGLYFSEMFLELVLDGHHVDPRVAEITYRVKGTDKVILVTDATQATGLPEGKYIRPGNREVWVKDGAVRFDSGILAGSVLTMEKAVQNCVQFLHVPIGDAVRMASTNPAANLHFSHLGSLIPGKQADLVLLDQDYSVQQTYVAGTKIFDQTMK
jgi:N-acetylglucosamine-6-phosphate deacetylase